MRGSISSARAMAIALALPAGKGNAALADLGVVPFAHFQDKVMRLGGFGGGDDLLQWSLRPAVGDIFADGGGEQQRGLQDDANLVAQ